jgi:hypothetical protein
MMDSQRELLSTDTPGLPEVIIDGRKVAPGSDEVWKETMDLVNMANLAKIRKRIDDQASQGWVKPYDNWLVSPNGEEFYVDPPGQALTIINDGPDPIQLAINDKRALLTINANQTYNLSFGNHTLKWFFLQCGAGLTATVRAEIKG